MLSFKQAAAATLALCGAVAAQAAGQIGTGPLAAPSSWTVSDSISGAGVLNDAWTFEIAASTFASATASSSYFTLTAPAAEYFKLSGFSATLDSTPLNLSTIVQTLGGGTQTTQLLTNTPVVLAAGWHTLTIGGTAGATGGGYTATLALTAAPVPEPETYAMMLAGLCTFAFLARRRRRD